MSIITAALGLVLYLLAKTVHLQIIEFCALTAALGLSFLVAAVAIGTKRPCLSAALYHASVLLPVTLGAELSCGIIYLTVSVQSWKTSFPSVPVEVFGVAVVVVLGSLSDYFRGMDWLLPANLAAFFTRLRYQKRFPQLYGHDLPKYKQAYNAIHLPALGDTEGEIQGWGYGSTCRRLELIRNAL